MLEGDLTDFTLPDVLRLLAFTSKTGRLTLDDGARSGRVELLDGRVRDASADAGRLPLARRILGAGLASGPALMDVLATRDDLPTDLQLARSLVEADQADAGTMAELLREQTVDAAFDLLRWPAGSFRFVAAPDAAGAAGVLELAFPVDELLEEATRRLDQWDALVGRTGALDAVVTIARPERGPGDHAEVSLLPDGWGLLALVDGRRTVADLVAVSGQGEYRTRRTLGGLLDEGVVTVGAAEEAGPLERLLRDQADLAEREQALAGRPPQEEQPVTPSAAARPTPAPAPAPAPARRRSRRRGGKRPARHLRPRRRRTRRPSGQLPPPLLSPQRPTTPPTPPTTMCVRSARRSARTGCGPTRRSTPIWSPV